MQSSAGVTGNGISESSRPGYVVPVTVTLVRERLQALDAL